MAGHTAHVKRRGHRTTEEKDHATTTVDQTTAGAGRVQPSAGGGARATGTVGDVTTAGTGRVQPSVGARVNVK